MDKVRQHGLKVVGGLGALFFLILFIRQPSFPTPDKLVIFLTLVFMMFERALSLLKRLLPFMLVVLAYELFRGMADDLNSHVNYSLAPAFDRWLFGDLPTIYLQNWLWHGQVSWYDFLYLPYLLHFVLPVGLSLIVWKNRASHYWHFVGTFLVVSFAAFLTFLIFPAAPPWLAAENGQIEPVIRISSDVWQSLGLHDFPSIYNQISPNAVAAIPSHHSAWATLIFIFVLKLYGRRWAVLAGLYPLTIYFITIYQGEHYAFDIFAGIAYAVVAYLLTPWLLRTVRKYYGSLSKHWEWLPR